MNKSTSSWPEFLSWSPNDKLIFGVEKDVGCDRKAFGGKDTDA